MTPAAATAVRRRPSAPHNPQAWILIQRNAKVAERYAQRALFPLLARFARTAADAIAAGEDAAEAVRRAGALRDAYRDTRARLTIAGVTAGFRISDGLFGRNGRQDSKGLLLAEAAGAEWRAAVHGKRKPAKPPAGRGVRLAAEWGRLELATRQSAAPIKAWLDEVTEWEDRTLSGQIEATVRRLLTDVAEDAEGRRSTYSLRDLSRAFLEESLADSRTRANMLARTNTNWAYNEGAEMSYRDAGLAAKEWLVTEDDALCDECAPFGGIVIPIGGAFGSALTEGLPDITHPPLHPNCRCALIPSFVTAEELA